MSKNRKQGGSLQGQLRKAGLVTPKQLRKAEKGLHRQEMRVKQGLAVDEERAAARQVQAEKTAADRLKNERRDRRAQSKALLAQVRQLIETNSQRQPGDATFNFADQKRIKKIYVSEDNKAQLNKGYLAVVRASDGYDLVPERVARRIMDRTDDIVLYIYDREQDATEDDDPYRDFEIPDDLEW